MLKVQIRSAFLTLLPCLISFANAAPLPLKGIAILGDSISDEYRADDQRGGTYGATTFNWVELLARERGFNVGAWGTRAIPRRSGYEYNWALSGSTIESMIENQQYTGVAQQVAQGQVSHVVVFIGANNFNFWNNTFQDIYEGKIIGLPLQKKIENLVALVEFSIKTIKSAGPVEMAIVSVADIGKSSRALLEYPDPQKRQRVSDAINLLNTGYQKIAASQSIAYVDFDQIYSSVQQRIISSDAILVGTEKINIFLQGNEPHYFNLDDDVSVHFGTVFSGILANKVFIEPFNAFYGQNFTPFTDEEILKNAGITPRSNIPPKILSFKMLKAELDPPGEFEVKERQIISFSVSSQDIDGDPLNWVWYIQQGTNTPQRLLKGQGTLPGFDFRIPAQTAGQTIKFSLYMTDGRDSVTQSATLAVIGSAGAGQATPDVEVFPNPFRPSVGDTKITFNHLPSSSALKVYTTTGNLVKQLQADASGEAIWLGAQDDTGKELASGVYIVLIEGNGEKRKIKVAIIR